jgi:hypothetical protein
MQSVAFNIPLVQSYRDWTPERRAKAAANVERLVLEFLDHALRSPLPRVR